MRGLEISSNDWAAGLCRCGEDWSESVSSHLSVIFTLCDSSLPAPRTNLKCSHPWHTLHLMQSAPDNWKGNATFILRMFSILFQTLKKITQPHNWLPLHPVSFTFKLVCTIISTSTSTLCLVLSLLFLLCMDFIHLVSVRFLDGSMRVTLCLYVLSVPTSLGLRKHSQHWARECLFHFAPFVSWYPWPCCYQSAWHITRPQYTLGKCQNAFLDE